MTSIERFSSLHRQGLVRIAAATPKGSVGDVAANAEGIVALARAAADGGADLVLFPELCLSSYAIDDLHLQDALLDRVEQEIGRIVAASGELPMMLIGAPLR
ncbi:MAG: nitrilase-related carbon-nitrogen hydrolase, partial [Pseudomonadota bacterium]|nr:nitrilase-related carbon-nitrogen hydrolase [Pseudomonadota bacterium]